MKSIKYFLFLVYLACFVPLTAQNIISGKVFLDKNGNGIQDRSEHGIKAVPVSNGRDVVLTDKDGNFSISVADGESLFPIIPSGYTSSSGDIIRSSDFLFKTRQSKDKVDFALKKEKQPEHFTLGAIGDIQMGNPQELDYANQTIIPELAGRKDIQLAVWLGDLVNNRLELFEDVREMIRCTEIPSWVLPGNHDRITNGHTLQDSLFNCYFGASAYAFNYGNVHFIILNNVAPDSKRGYKARISDRQMTFIKNDLSYVPKDRFVVFCQHIPLVHTENIEDLKTLLNGRNKLFALSGHTHRVSRHFIPIGNAVMQELVAGATCGHWWVGEKDWLGVPLALMQCDAPRNYFTIEFSPDDYQIHFKGVGLDSERQMDIWVQGCDTIDRHVKDFREFARGEIFANIYGGSDSTEVSIQIGNTLPVRMEKVEVTAPTVTRQNQWYKDKIYPTKISRRSPLRKSASTHLWHFRLPENLMPGIYPIRIEAKDTYGFSVSGVRIVRIEDPDTPFDWRKRR